MIRFTHKTKLTETNRHFTQRTIWFHLKSTNRNIDSYQRNRIQHNQSAVYVYKHNKQEKESSFMRIPNGRAYSAIITSQSSHTSLSGGGGGWPAVERAATKEDSKITVNSKETHLFASTQSVVPMKYKKPKLKVCFTSITY